MFLRTSFTLQPLQILSIFLYISYLFSAVWLVNNYVTMSCFCSQWDEIVSTGELRLQEHQNE